MALASATDIERFHYRPLALISAAGELDRIEVDVGCGSGGLLVRLAAGHPRTHFIGVELASELAHRAADRAAVRGLRNVTVINGEAAAYIDSLPAQSVGALHIYFPTPYPRSIGLSARLFGGQFGRCAYRVLQVGGILRLLTDHEEYYREVLGVLCRSQEPWRATAWLPVAAGLPPGQIVGTYWEQRVAARQGQIWSLCVVR